MIDISLSICTITRDTVAPVHQSITVKINHLAVTNTLNIPSRQLISEIIMEYEIALVINKILWLELKETRDVLGTRKERHMNKRMIIKGEYYIIIKLILKKIKTTIAEIEKRRGSRKKDNTKKELLDVIELLLDNKKEYNEEIEQT
jgi:hypothetical protein